MSNNKTKGTESGQQPDTDPNRKKGLLELFAVGATRWAGSSWAFAIALGCLILWAVSGPFFDFSEMWQLIVNTGTTIITFLMVFLIQRSQNKDSQAVHLKLNELLAAMEGASNRLVNSEDLAEDQLHTLHQHYATLAKLAAKETEVTHSHSIEEAERRHESKRGAAKVDETS